MLPDLWVVVLQRKTEQEKKLVNLGERESSVATFERAVRAFETALEERTRESVPLDWAAT
jgi:hypothetical protein